GHGPQSVREFGSAFFFSSRRRHTRFSRDWSSDVCSSDLPAAGGTAPAGGRGSRGRASGDPRKAKAPARSPAGRRPGGGRGAPPEIGRASCRERGEVAEGGASLTRARGGESYTRERRDRRS